MADAWPCPGCARMVESTGISTGTGVGPILPEANRSHTDCPDCGAPLMRTTTAPDPSWRFDDDRVTVKAFAPPERSDGGQDEQWQARVWEGPRHEGVDVVVTGSAVCTGNGVDEALVEQFVREKVNAIPH